MRGWFARNLAVINLVLTVSCIISYIVIVYSLVYWTHWGGQIGELGGVLDYNWLGESVLYHATKEGLRGVRLFSFLDVPSYLLWALIIINGVALNVSDLEKAEPGGVHVLRLAVLNLILAMLCMVVYVGWTMMFIDGALKRWETLGGVVDYVFPFGMIVTHVYQGHFQSSLNTGGGPDLSLWFLFLLLISTVVAIKLQLRSKP